jgi:predicted nucleic acid-binding protein
MLKKLIKFPAKVIIDTGPLLLFLAGNYDPEYIPKIKRIKYGGEPCNKIHYDILMQYLNHTKERLITPGILSEAWNLIDNDISNKKDKKELFDANINYFKLMNEIYVPKNEILSDKYLSSNAWKFGFTDSSIILCAKNNSACVLTQDFPLFNICKNLKIDTNHLSSILSLADL